MTALILTAHHADAADICASQLIMTRNRVRFADVKSVCPSSFDNVSLLVIACEWDAICPQTRALLDDSQIMQVIAADLPAHLAAHTQ